MPDLETMAMAELVISTFVQDFSELQFQPIQRGRETTNTGVGPLLLYFGLRPHAHLNALPASLDPAITSPVQKTSLSGLFVFSLFALIFYDSFW